MTATAVAPGIAGPRRPVRWTAVRWVRAHPGLVLALLVPWLVFGAPVLDGRVFLDGDNFLQNFPLRVLVGQDLRQLHLPLLDPYLFSGTPLLGGFNAGAAYPGTWLFAALPSQTAWTVNLALVYDVTLAGTYAFLRRQPLGPSAATLGAVTFAFGGYMAGQIVHIDIIEGASWLPWMLLAVHALTTPPDPGRDPAVRRRHRRWWTGVLALAVGMSLLAGGPEAFIDGGILALVYLASRLWDQGVLRRAQRWWGLPALGAVTVAGVTGIALGAAQLLPGLAFLGQSQRSAGTYTFFTSGSLPARTVALLVSPFVLGTNQNAPAYYAGPYNFPEVTSYLGILPLIAALALLARRWRRRPDARARWVWYVVIAFGLLSAVGGATPFGHVLYALPGVKDQRLLNRNLLLVDFSLAVLFAWFVHLLLADHQVRTAAGSGEPGPPGDRPTPARAGPWSPGRRAETALTCLPVALVALACLLLWTVPGRLQSALDAQFTVSVPALRGLAVVATVELVVAAAGTAVVLAGDRWTATTLRRLLTVVVVVDLAVFTGLVLHAPTTKTAAHARGALARQFSSLTGDGRFVIYDPDQFEDTQLYLLGQTDLNVNRHQASAQGYAALVDNGYYDATGSHAQEDLDPRTLATPVWDQLNTRVLLTLPSYFVTPTPGQATTLPFPVATTAAEDAGPGPTGLPPGGSHTWYLGGTLTATTGSVPVAAGDPAALRLAVVEAGGTVRPLAATDVTAAAGRIDFTLGAPTAIAGLVATDTGTGPVTVPAPTLRTVGDGEVTLDGRLQSHVVPPHWVYSGTIGAFGIFRNTRVHGWAWAVADDGGPVPAGTAVHGTTPAADGSQRVAVRSTGPVTVVRSMAWTTGWRASARPVSPTTGAPTGPAVALTVEPAGTVQQVRLPSAGTWVVTFTYRTTSAVVGIAASAVAGLGVAAWVVAEAIGVRRRRARRRRGRPRVNPG
jgi:hypothetical protein